MVATQSVVFAAPHAATPTRQTHIRCRDLSQLRSRRAVSWPERRRFLPPPIDAGHYRNTPLEDLALKKLLAAHQAIIDAWFDKWQKEQQARIKVVFARKRHD